MMTFMRFGTRHTAAANVPLNLALVTMCADPGEQADALERPRMVEMGETWVIDYGTTLAASDLIEL